MLFDIRGKSLLEWAIGRETSQTAKSNNIAVQGASPFREFA